MQGHNHDSPCQSETCDVEIDAKAGRGIKHARSHAPFVRSSPCVAVACKRSALTEHCDK
jgi:hypothetical protein